MLSLPVDVEGGSEDTITALVELFAGDVKVTSATVDLPGAATTALQASLDPSEHHWITAKGPWSIRVSNLSSGVGDIILDGLGTIGVACSQPIKA